MLGLFERKVMNAGEFYFRRDAHGRADRVTFFLLVLN
jgi:hypothetical protein